MHSKRHDLNFSFDDSQFRFEGTTESRPHLLDWNRDGSDDLVLVLLNSETTLDEETQKTKYKFGYHIFTNTDSASRAAAIAKGQQTEADRKDDAEEKQSMGAPTTGADLKIKLDHFRPEHEDFNRKQLKQLPVRVHIEFADVDGDGNKDLLYSESEFKHVPEMNTEITWHKFEKTESSIFWQRNLTSQGEPRFDKAIKLCDAPDDWIIHSFSVADLNQDGIPNVVANVFRGTSIATESELWLLGFVH